jgi:phage tail-like protein
VWKALPAPAALLDPARFLQLRIRLERRLDAAPDATPSLDQIEARTAAETLYDRLPGTYARTAADGVLPLLLAFAQATLDDLEERVADLPRSFTAATADAAELAPLAGWQALALPDGDLAGAAQPARALLDELPDLYAARGTPAGIARYVEALTGVRAQLFELFRERSVWLLGENQALGVGTGLAPAGLGGLVVGTSAIGEAVPDDPQPLGEALFEEWAHRFVALVPLAAAPTAELQARVRRALEEELPAHCDYHLCFTGPSARVGIQARVGVDAILAGPPSGTPLDERALLGVHTRLAPSAAR